MTMTAIVNILTCIFEAITIVMFMTTYVRDGKQKRPAYLHTAAVVALALLIHLSNRIASITILNIVFIWISIFFLSFIYNRNIKVNLIMSVMLVLIFTATEIVTLFIVTFLTGISAEEATAMEAYRVLGIVLSKMFAFAILKTINIKHQDKRVFSMKTAYWLLFFLIFATSTLEIYLLFIFQYHSNASSIYNELAVWGSFGLLYNTFFSLYLYENIAKQAEIERNQDLFKQQIKAQSKHLDEILITQNQVKKLRHDLINHNISIQAYFEKQDCASGLAYMKGMNQNAIFSDTLIETGNAALDAILNTKKSIALSKNIVFDTRIQVPENIFVDAIDICIIFGNALDNSIEACEKIENGPKKISVSIIYESDSLICKIVNTAVKGKNKFLHTSKADRVNHGFGIENITSALEKYKNICRFDQTDTEFILSFVILKD